MGLGPACVSLMALSRDYLSTSMIQVMLCRHTASVGISVRPDLLRPIQHILILAWQRILMRRLGLASTQEDRMVLGIKEPAVWSVKLNQTYYIFKESLLQILTLRE